MKIPKEKVKLHVARIGGGFGRRLDLDFTIEAIKVAQEIKTPVKLFWTREDDIQQDGYRPFSYHRLQAGLDNKSNLSSWLHRQAGTSRRPDHSTYSLFRQTQRAQSGAIENRGHGGRSG